MGSSNINIITFTWKPPLHIDGIVTNYSFQCSIPGDGVTRNLIFDSSQTTTTLSGLLPYTSYFCNITAHTSVGRGPAATTSVTTQQDGESKHNHLRYSCNFYFVIQFPVDHPKTSLSQPLLVHSLSPGLLLSPHNVMELSSAISSPTAQEAASLTAPEPAIPV